MFSRPSVTSQTCEAVILWVPVQSSAAIEIMRAGLQGTSAGAKDQEADNFLEKRFKNDPRFSYEETVQTAIAALQNVLSEDFKATEIEVSLRMSV